jgi:hypothetical protein
MVTGAQALHGAHVGLAVSQGALPNAAPVYAIIGIAMALGFGWDYGGLNAIAAIVTFVTG